MSVVHAYPVTATSGIWQVCGLSHLYQYLLAVFESEKRPFVNLLGFSALSLGYFVASRSSGLGSGSRGKVFNVPCPWSPRKCREDLRILPG